MASITMKDLQEAFKAGTLLTYGTNEVWSSDRIENAFDEWLGEDRVDLLGEPDDTTDPVLEDLDVVYTTLDTVRQELVDEAVGSNIARKHHLESAVSCFADIDILLQAEKIVRQVLDIREHEEAPTTDSPGGS